jgi:hypothetical protein
VSGKFYGKLRVVFYRQGVMHVNTVTDYIMNKKLWEELIAYFPFNVILVPDTSRKKL